MAVKLRAAIDAIPGYKPGKPAPDGAWKLSSNENPCEPIPAVLDAIAAAAKHINRYPQTDAGPLRERLGALLGVDADHLLITNGSVSGIAQLLSAVCGPGDEVVYAWRSFEAYPLLVAATGATAIQVPLTADHEHDLDAMADAITDNTRVVMVCSPNNPTGTLVSQEQFDAFADRVPNDVLIILDEAYIEFVREPAIDGIAAQAHRDNVVVLRTFSKAYGLAGLRVGYMIGDPDLLRGADNAGVPFAVDRIAQSGAIAALDNAGEVFARVEALTDQRERIYERLIGAGAAVPKPHGNFIWVPTTAAQHAAVADILERNGIVARVFPDGVRITVGERESQDQVVAAATEILAIS